MPYSIKTFPNEKTHTWEEVCPDCKEEFIQHKGGAQCLSKNCEFKQLEEKHRLVAKPMADYLLPNNKVEVNFPDIQWEGVWGWSTPFGSGSISIPWYTLRVKDRFFNNLVHESAHIPTALSKTSLRSQKILELYNKLLIGYKQGEILGNEIFSFYNKHKKVIEDYKKKGEGGHFDKWYLLYFHEKLLSSPYGIYAYGNVWPLSYGLMASGAGRSKGQIQRALNLGCKMNIMANPIKWEKGVWYSCNHQKRSNIPCNVCITNIATERERERDFEQKTKIKRDRYEELGKEYEKKSLYGTFSETKKAEMAELEVWCRTNLPYESWSNGWISWTIPGGVKIVVNTW